MWKVILLFAVIMLAGCGTTRHKIMAMSPVNKAVFATDRHDLAKCIAAAVTKNNNAIVGVDITVEEFGNETLVIAGANRLVFFQYSLLEIRGETEVSIKTSNGKSNSKAWKHVTDCAG